MYRDGSGSIDDFMQRFRPRYPRTFTALQKLMLEWGACYAHFAMSVMQLLANQPISGHFERPSGCDDSIILNLRGMDEVRQTVRVFLQEQNSL